MFKLTHLQQAMYVQIWYDCFSQTHILYFQIVGKSDTIEWLIHGRLGIQRLVPHIFLRKKVNLPIKNKNSTIGTIEMYDEVLCLLRSLVRLVVDVFTADLPNMVVCFAKLPKLLGSMSQLFYKILQIRYLTFTICYSY